MVKPRRLFLLAVAGIWCLSSLIIYSSILSIGLLSDDYVVLSRLEQGLFYTKSFFRPVADIGLYVDWVVFQANPLWLHAHNLLLHGFLSFLVTQLLVDIQRYWGHTPHKPAAFFAGLIFLLYPFAAEAFVWVVGRGIIISAILVALSLLMFFRRSQFFFGSSISLFCYVFAIAGYETAFALPLIVWMLAGCKFRSWQRGLYYSSPYLLVSIAFILLRWIFHTSGNNLGYYRLETSPVQWLRNLVAILGRILVPPFVQSWIFVTLLALVVLLVCLFWYILNRTKNKNRHFVGLLGGLVVLSVLPAITIGIDTHDFEGGRFIYLPAVFFALFISVSVNSIFIQPVLRNAVFIGLSIFYFWQGRLVQHDWRQAAAISTAILKGDLPLKAVNLFYNVPDVVNGAYVFRNGLAEALVKKGKLSSFQQVIVKSSISLPRRKNILLTGVPAGSKQATQIFGKKFNGDTAFFYFNESAVLEKSR